MKKGGRERSRDCSARRLRGRASGARRARSSGGLALGSAPAPAASLRSPRNRRGAAQQSEVRAAARSPAPPRLHDIGRPGRGEMLIRKRQWLQCRARGRSGPAARLGLLCQFLI